MLIKPQDLGHLILPYEIERIVDAVRRDMQRQLTLARINVGWEDFHAMQARQDLAILELLNPKTIRPGKFKPYRFIRWKVFCTCLRRDTTAKVVEKTYDM